MSSDDAPINDKKTQESPLKKNSLDNPTTQSVPGVLSMKKGKESAADSVGIDYLPIGAVISLEDSNHAKSQYGTINLIDAFATSVAENVLSDQLIQLEDQVRTSLQQS